MQVNKILGLRKGRVLFHKTNLFLAKDDTGLYDKDLFGDHLTFTEIILKICCRVLKKQILFFLFFLLPTAIFAETALEKRANALYQEVRCPVCLGQSIAESETKESEVLKTFILDQIQRGESEEAIRKKLRSLYGDEIIFRPPFETHTLFLWLTPFGLFFFLFLGLLWKGYEFTLMKRREK